MNTLIARTAFLLAVLTAVPLAGQPPDLAVDQLAEGPYSRMRALLERTIFRVDVLTVEIRVDRATQQRLQAQAAGREYSESLAADIVLTVLDTRQVFVEAVFERDVPFARWLEGVRDNLALASAAGLIGEEAFLEIVRNLPTWFAPVADRGFRQGDRLLYRGYPDRLRTVLVGAAGDVLLDQTDSGPSHRRNLLAGYLAPGTDLREPLIRSLP